MDKRQYEQAFDKFYSCRKYSEALEVVGAMKYSGIPGARYLEMLVYYEQGEYEKIRSALKGKRIDNIEEREFYLAALIELMLYSEFESYYSEYDSISEACLNYICGLMRAQGHSWMPEHKAVMDYPTYFDRRYRWFVAETMTDVFNLNDEKRMLIEAGMPHSAVNDLTRKLTDKFEMIEMTDAVRVLIKSYVDENRPIPADNVLYLPLLYSVPEDELDTVFKRYENLRDITDYLQLSRRIHVEGVEENAISAYWREISEAVHEGNVYMTGIMAGLYADKSHFKSGGMTFGMESVSDRIHAALERDAAYVIKEIESHEMVGSLEKTMSQKGIFAYRAAGWMFCNALKNSTLDREGHILCLSFLRIIEYEINERIIFPLCQEKNIRQMYEDFKSKLDVVCKGEISKEWDYRIACLDKAGPYRHERLRFAEIMAVFDALKFKRYKKESVHREFAAKCRAEVGEMLTDEGRTALADGSLVRMIEPRKLELFRHPYTITRYSGLEMALSARRYVEQELENLARYVGN